MKKKFSILIDIAVICFCICALAIGVYSATTAQLTVSGTIGFTAHECELDVKISKQGHAKEDGLTQYYDTPQYIDFDITEEKENIIGRLGGKEATIKGPVNLGSMNFTDLATNTIPPIIVKVTVTNRSAFPVSGFVMVEVPKDSNIIYTRQHSLGSSTTLNEHSSALILNNQESVTFTITFKVGAFYDCQSLTEIIIPDSVTTIGNDAFGCCYSLTSFTIGSNVTKIGDHAFSGCSNLTITCIATSVPTATNAFVAHAAYYATTIVSINVLPELVDTYKTTDGWSAYADKIHGITN